MNQNRHYTNGISLDWKANHPILSICPDQSQTEPDWAAKSTLKSPWGNQHVKEKNLNSAIDPNFRMKGKNKIIQRIREDSRKGTIRQHRQRKKVEGAGGGSSDGRSPSPSHSGFLSLSRACTEKETGPWENRGIGMRLQKDVLLEMRYSEGRHGVPVSVL